MIKEGTTFNIQEQQQIIESEIENLQWPSHPQDLYEPVKYMMQLGGKRLRPVLTLLACQMCGGNIQNAIKPALAMEVFHNFTLVHDDLMDNATLRRGKQTVHQKWNATTAILSGDVMLVLAYDLLLNTPADKLQAVIQLFNQTARKVCEGQQLDMVFENRQHITENEYIEMIGLKTAALLAGCLKLGALLTDAPLQVANQLYNCGYLLGTAFQIQDDLLDSYGDTEKFGKRIGGDILAGKKTFLTVKAFEFATAETAENLQRLLLNKNQPDQFRIDEVLNIYNLLEINKIAEETRNRYFNDGLAILNTLPVAEASKTAFTQLAESLIHRKS